MAYLFDTGFLLRLFHKTDPDHGPVRAAFKSAKISGEELFIAQQNIAEFWNVSTRPISSRGGFGLSIDRAAIRLSFLERNFRVLSENTTSYQILKRLLVEYGVKGVQTHDARLVAVAKAHGISKIITLNVGDFLRYKTEISMVALADV